METPQKQADGITEIVRKLAPPLGHAETWLAQGRVDRAFGVAVRWVSAGEKFRAARYTP